MGSAPSSRVQGSSGEAPFFTDFGEASRYEVTEVVGKGSYGVVAAAVDTHTGERVAIKKINDVFEHISDATRILREIKLLRLLRHPDIVQIKHIMLPPSRRDFRDIYVVFELMESDLHQVIKANDELSAEHQQFFLYQLLRGMKYIHAANVFHRDLKPRNILANGDCKLKICDFGLARVSFNDTPSAIFWTDYVATRWYRAPELCGSFFAKYTPAIDIWSIGCIFAEMLTGKPLFPGKNVVHQLDLMTDLLGTPSAETLSKIRNEKARRYLANMRKKPPVPFTQKFPGIDPMALHLLKRLLAFDPKDRPTAAEILEYHPQMLQEYLCGGDMANFVYPSGVDRFKRQFAHLEEGSARGEKTGPQLRQHVSLPSLLVSLSLMIFASCLREKVNGNGNELEKPNADYVIKLHVCDLPTQPVADGVLRVRNFLKSESIGASRCVVIKQLADKDEV
ncbi:hypothetical protein PR202_gb05391 [Eleusine coracana subsp. coracana]|uniref:mitogen-activated protein kinase n=1 Tax=Eleusine coracana subsp. coracana TaxID=191504 RepID=A0AAV5E7S0_ELECO|nr:hypothetical protein PR202_gb05391 [Eleusine coracana subsp. coracana]